jgi:16S rRNA (cytosine967-C5)-methyltransferase
MKHFSHLNSAAAILRQYRGQQPFHHFIKDYFRQDKKYGSKDRKNISHLCYAYFRLGPSLAAMAIEEKILLGLFLCATQPGELLQSLRPEWNAAVQQTVKEKCVLAGITWEELSIFPFTGALSDVIDAHAFVLSHLQQPDLFIRLRPGHEKMVLEKLHKAAEPYRRLNDTCIAFSNAAKIDALLDLDKEAVVQDYSSQRIGEFLLLAGSSAVIPIHAVWDCCAASGGKSILAKDVLGDIQLTVSDIRKQILVNLQKRFATAGIKNYESFVMDLADNGRATVTPPTQTNRGTPIPQAPVYDLIIADAPCSGSGTWGRTPESLSFFKEAEIERYQALQKQVVANAFPRLKKGGCFLYITCSVFKKENEEMVSFIQQQFNTRLVQAELLKGYTQKADTMFAALFVNEG